MRVIISGASGLIGTALSASLHADGHQVVALVRRAAGPNEIQWDPAKGVLAADALDGADAVVHLAGAGIGDHRWTAEYKREILDSRVRSTTLLADTIHNFSDALTAIPLWIAFALSTKAATRRYTYGFGRAEDLAGLFVVVMIALILRTVDVRREITR